MDFHGSPMALRCTSMDLPWVSMGFPWSPMGRSWVSQRCPMDHPWTACTSRGNSWVSRGLPWVSRWFSWSTMGLPWVSRGFPWTSHVLPWISRGLPWDFHWSLMGVSWAAYGPPMGFRWVSIVRASGCPRVGHGSPMDAHVLAGIARGCPWAVHGLPRVSNTLVSCGIPIGAPRVAHGKYHGRHTHLRNPYSLQEFMSHDLDHWLPYMNTYPVYVSYRIPIRRHQHA